MISKKTAIITGCNRGIGKEILRTFAKNEANIWACTREKNDEFSKEIDFLQKKNDIWIRNINFDFANAEATKQAAKKIISESNSIDILVNNAGVIETSLFQMTKINSIRKLFDINYFSQLIFSQVIISKMIKKKAGSIINISSTSAIDANVGRLAYVASKSALLVSSQVLSKELANYNIRVNIIAPGLTNTDLMKNNHTESILNETISRISMKRIAEPEEIANVVLFLASNLSSYITGQIIRVDGGLT